MAVHAVHDDSVSAPPALAGVDGKPAAPSEAADEGVSVWGGELEGTSFAPPPPPLPAQPASDAGQEPHLRLGGAEKAAARPPARFGGTVDARKRGVAGQWGVGRHIFPSRRRGTTRTATPNCPPPMQTEVDGCRGRGGWGRRGLGWQGGAARFLQAPPSLLALDATFVAAFIVFFFSLRVPAACPRKPPRPPALARSALARHARGAVWPPPRRTNRLPFFFAPSTHTMRRAVSAASISALSEVAADADAQAGTVRFWLGGVGCVVASTETRGPFFRVGAHFGPPPTDGSPPQHHLPASKLIPHTPPPS